MTVDYSALRTDFASDSSSVNVKKHMCGSEILVNWNT